MLFEGAEGMAQGEQKMEKITNREDAKNIVHRKKVSE